MEQGFFYYFFSITQYWTTSENEALFVLIHVKNSAPKVFIHCSAGFIAILDRAIDGRRKYGAVLSNVADVTVFSGCINSTVKKKIKTAS